MKKESTFAYILRLTLTLLVITGVMAMLLAGVNALTEERIDANKQEKTAKAVQVVLPNAENPQLLSGYPAMDGVTAVYQDATGYAVRVTVSGFGGDVDMMVGVSTDGTVTGISIISHAETPGLGALAASSNDKGVAFREQFLGVSGEQAVVKDGGDIEALTSATITSRAVTSGVNIALRCVESLTNG